MKLFKMARKYGPRVAVPALALVPLFSHATGIDVTAATAGVTDAQTALLSLLTAFIGLSAAIYGVVKVYGFLRKKAGA